MMKMMKTVKKLLPLVLAFAILSAGRPAFGASRAVGDEKIAYYCYVCGGIRLFDNCGICGASDSKNAYHCTACGTQRNHPDWLCSVWLYGY